MSSENENNSCYKDFVLNLLQGISKIYWSKMIDYYNKNNIKPNQVTGFLLNPEKLVISIGRTHIALEYYGREKLDKINDNFFLSVEINDYSKENSDNFFEKVIGINFDSTLNFKIPLLECNEELISPTNKAADKLIELGWNFAAQSGIFGYNISGYYIPEGQFCKLINCIFFDSNESGLITRRVKWIDFIPVSIDEDSYQDKDVFKIDFRYYYNNWLQDLLYEFPMPHDFKYGKLVQLNKFIEVSGCKNYSEPQITDFLSLPENIFILTMGFFSKEVYPQVLCEWQSEDKQPIKPDFFVVKPNGYADIVEFKLPYLKGSTVVGSTNRERFSAEIQAYIAQTRIYRNYFDDPNNRKWIEEKYGFKVYKPRRYLVMGRRFDFNSEEWQEIKSDYHDLEIFTYDDLIDGAISQFYM
ncbi:MAG TPA: Shedu anti-phage system protein SduA domain-containing protein [Clostridia bacterium]